MVKLQGVYVWRVWLLEEASMRDLRKGFCRRLVLLRSDVAGTLAL